jgi:molybdate transport system permease protein
MIWGPFFLSLKVVGVAVCLIVLFGLSLALMLARNKFRGHMFLELLILLPLVLPPSVVGYYLLRILGNSNPVIRFLHAQILFTWPAASIASAVVGLPLMVQASKAAIEGVDKNLENAARTLGSSEVEILWRITFPLARRGIIAGLVLSATRAFGEFGATLMIAGNMPGRTQTLPLAIYDAVQNREYGLANTMVLVMTGFSLLSLYIVRLITSSRSLFPRLRKRERRSF